MIKIKMLIISICFLAIQESDAQWLGYQSTDQMNQQLHMQQLQAEQMRQLEQQRQWNDMNNRMYIQQMEMQMRQQHELTNRSLNMNPNWRY